MVSTTRIVGILLILLGIGAYVGTGRTSVTALIPAFFGVVYVLLALGARNEAARKHVMHAAVALSLVGAIAALGRAVPALRTGAASMAAVGSQLVMAVLLLIHLVLGIQSFIAARKARR